MKRTLGGFSLLIILSVIFLLAIVTIQSSAQAQDLSKSGIDYQKGADLAGWDWKDEKANPLWSISQSGGKYGIVMVSEPGDRLASHSKHFFERRRSTPGVGTRTRSFSSCEIGFTMLGFIPSPLVEASWPSI